jgi:phosphoenolpyruvate synthase/pyruvate phosphate dikinase
VDRVRLAWAALGTTGGKASHLAVICRGWGKPCVVGLDQLKIDADRRCLRYKDRVIPEFMEVILSGNSGRLYLTDKVQSAYRVKRQHGELVRRLADIVIRQAGSDRFRRLDLPAQMKFAHAAYVLRPAGAIQ